MIGGDTIKIAPGLYEISSTIQIEKPLKLVGSNEIIVDKSRGLPEKYGRALRRSYLIQELC
jgi:hypothetical protein